MLRFREMTDADIDIVTAAEGRCHVFPWTRGNLADSLAAGHDAWVATDGQKMIGYAIMMLAVDEAHLLNITVLPEFQRRGRGGLLLDFLLDRARRGACTRILLEVRPGNIPGLGLYLRHGFVEIGRRRDYYHAHNGREDAIVMARDL